MSLANLNIITEIRKNGHLILDIPTDLKEGKVEVKVEISPLQEKNEKSLKYDFSDLVGKLKWKGDAVKEQRKIRDEWESQ